MRVVVEQTVYSAYPQSGAKKDWHLEYKKPWNVFKNGRFFKVCNNFNKVSDLLSKKAEKNLKKFVNKDNVDRPKKRSK